MGNPASLQSAPTLVFRMLPLGCLPILANCNFKSKRTMQTKQGSDSQYKQLIINDFRCNKLPILLQRARGQRPLSTLHEFEADLRQPAQLRWRFLSSGLFAERLLSAMDLPLTSSREWRVSPKPSQFGCSLSDQKFGPKPTCSERKQPGTPTLQQGESATRLTYKDVRLAAAIPPLVPRKILTDFYYYITMLYCLFSSPLLGLALQAGVEHPVDHEQGPLDTTNFPKGEGQFILARIASPSAGAIDSSGP